jgi:hypothetical protein
MSLYTLGSPDSTTSALIQAEVFQKTGSGLRSRGVNFIPNKNKPRVNPRLVSESILGIMEA